MLGAAGLYLLAVCFVSHCSARLLVALEDQDYSQAGPKEVLVDRMKKVLSRMTAVQAAHPRLQRLYKLLKKELRQSLQQDSRLQVLDFSKTLRPTYDVVKLNRVYTTEPAFVAR